ncbi:MAG: hypothetical protein ABIK09_14060 [Pseudomonadota bacterium]
MGTRARLVVLALALVSCETRYGTPVDPSTLGYHPCVAAGDCVIEGGRGPDLREDGTADEALSPCDADCAGEPFRGRWILIETQAVTTVDMPFVGVLETTSVHHYLADIVPEGNALVMHQELCELEIFEQTCHHMGITVIPQAYVAAIGPLTRRVERTGAAFVSERVTALRGAVLDDPVNDPMPTLEDPTGAVDQDGDGHPGMTVLLDGVFAGTEVYTAQRWWSELHGAVVTPDYVEGLVGHGNETNTLGADPPALAYQTHNGAHEDPTRSFFRMQRVSDDFTCADLVVAAYGDAPCQAMDRPITDCPMKGFDHLDGTPITCAD